MTFHGDLLNNITMGGQGVNNEYQTVWNANRQENPYQFFLNDLLCDVTLTVSSADPSHFNVSNFVPEDENDTKEIVNNETKEVIMKRSFKAHRLILACHSEYFHRMFISCGMREVSGEVNLDWIDPEVFEAILRYIYTGKILEDYKNYDENIELLSGIFIAADMFQMIDLETAALQRISKCCTPKNCLSLYLLVENLDSLATISAPAVLKAKEEIVVILKETLKEQWITEVIKSESFLDLELNQLLTIISLKAEEEELAGDFSFSFVQSDIAEGIVAWVNHNINERCTSVVTERNDNNMAVGGELSWWFCLHQLKASSRKNALNMIHESQRIISKKNCSSDSSNSSDKTHQKIGDRFKESVNVDALCNGRLCPRRLHYGLLIIHAWTPNVKNSITADHVAYNFVRLEELEKLVPASYSNSPGRHFALDGVLRSTVPYTLREFGELGVGEKHCILPNNVLTLPKSQSSEDDPIEKKSDLKPSTTDNLADKKEFRKMGDRFRDMCHGNAWGGNDQVENDPPYHMILTIDDSRYSGMVIDGVDRKSKCNFHHSVIYHYCPSNIEECGCSNKNQDVLDDLENSLLKVGGHVSICADLKGYVYLVSNCRKNIGKTIDSDLDAMKNVSDFDPSCETFKQINKNVKDNLTLEKYGNTNKIMNRDKEITQIVSGAMVAVTEHDTDTLSAKYLVQFGGWKFSSRNETKNTPNVSKGIYSYVYCIYDLQEYHESTERFNVVNQPGAGAVEGSRYKSGHSKIVTELVSLDDPPSFNMAWDVFDLQNNVWLNQNSDEQHISSSIQNSSIPFCAGDAATLVIGQSLYVIGGYKVESDKDWTQNLLYQMPLYEVWICDMKTMKWTMGPPLPIHKPSSQQSNGNRSSILGYFKGTAYSLPGNVGIVYSGGASLKINSETCSNQIYEYVPNTKVLMWRFDGTMHAKSWKVIYDVSDVINCEKTRHGRNNQSNIVDDYSIYAAIPTNACLPSFKVHRGQLVQQTFRKNTGRDLIYDSEIKAPWLQDSNIDGQQSFSWNDII